jgi:hypothetical protein
VLLRVMLRVLNGGLGVHMLLPLLTNDALWRRRHAIVVAGVKRFPHLDMSWRALPLRGSGVTLVAMLLQLVMAANTFSLPLLRRSPLERGHRRRTRLLGGWGVTVLVASIAKLFLDTDYRRRTPLVREKNVNAAVVMVNRPRFVLPLTVGGQ